MKVELRSNGTVHISGYVNAVERDSRVLPAKMAPSATGNFVEQIRAGTFARSLRRRPKANPSNVYRGGQPPRITYLSRKGISYDNI